MFPSCCVALSLSISAGVMHVYEKLRNLKTKNTGNAFHFQDSLFLLGSGQENVKVK